MNVNWDRKDIKGIYTEDDQLHGINRHTKKTSRAPTMQQHFTPFQCLSIFCLDFMSQNRTRTNSLSLPSDYVHSVNSALARRQYFSPPEYPLSLAHPSSVAVTNVLLKTALASPSFLPLSVTKYPGWQHKANAVRFVPSTTSSELSLSCWLISYSLSCVWVIAVLLIDSNVICIRCGNVSDAVLWSSGDLDSLPPCCAVFAGFCECVPITFFIAMMWFNV